MAYEQKWTGAIDGHTYRVVCDASGTLPTIVERSTTDALGETSWLRVGESSQEWREAVATALAAGAK